MQPENDMFRHVVENVFELNWNRNRTICSEDFGNNLEILGKKIFKKHLETLPSTNNPNITHTPFHIPKNISTAPQRTRNRVGNTNKQPKVEFGFNFYCFYGVSGDEWIKECMTNDWLF